jgi:hypothetical protein
MQGVAEAAPPEGVSHPVTLSATAMADNNPSGDKNLEFMVFV